MFKIKRKILEEHKKDTDTQLRINASNLKASNNLNNNSPNNSLIRV